MHCVIMRKLEAGGFIYRKCLPTALNHDSKHNKKHEAIPEMSHGSDLSLLCRWCFCFLVYAQLLHLEWERLTPMHTHTNAHTYTQAKSNV